jgi:hypothetical protein
MIIYNHCLRYKLLLLYIIMYYAFSYIFVKADKLRDLFRKYNLFSFYTNKNINMIIYIYIHIFKPNKRIFKTKLLRAI